MSLDEVWEMLSVNNPQITRSSLYRTFCRSHINQILQQQREKAKKFKEYEPGYLHMDVTYLPAFKGKKRIFLLLWTELQEVCFIGSMKLKPLKMLKIL